MDLLISGETATFNPEIKKGSFIRVRHKNWAEARNGLVARVTPNYLLILWLTGVNRNASYFSIWNREVANGEWDIWLSFDCEEIYTAQIVEADDD